jgi:uncharacterized membrane protein YeiB
MFIGQAIQSSIQWYERPLAAVPTVQESEDRIARLLAAHDARRNSASTVHSPFFSVDEIRREVDDRLGNPLYPIRTLENLLGYAGTLVPFMLLGFLLWQTGVLRRSWEHRRLLVVFLVVGGGIGVSTGWCSDALYERGLLLRFGLTEPLTPWLQAVDGFCRDISRPTLDLAYIGLVGLLLSSTWWSHVLRTLAPAGRMAFTNYVLHCILPPVLFPLLFGWWLPEPGTTQAVLKVSGVFIFLVLFSTWWMKRFHFGPFEWLWRSLTYWKLQPMRVRPSSPTT